MNNSRRNKQETNGLMMYTYQQANEYEVVEHKQVEKQVEY